MSFIKQIIKNQNSKTVLLLLVTAIFLATEVSAVPPTPSVTDGTCTTCGLEGDSVSITGVLEAISYKAQLLQISNGTNTTVLKYDDDTILLGVESISALSTPSVWSVTYREDGDIPLAISIEAAQPDLSLNPKQIDASTLASLLSVPPDKAEFTLIDSRTSSAFNASHIDGAISVYDGDFDNSLYRLPTDKSQLIIFYCDGSAWKLSSNSAGRAEKAGYTNVKVLSGGLPAWQALGLPLIAGGTVKETIFKSSTELEIISASEFIDIITNTPSSSTLLDVRSLEEVRAGSIPNTLLIPVDNILERLPEIPLSKDIIVFCRSGVRAEMAYSLLKERGYSVRYLSRTLDIKEDGSFSIVD